jgi:hypothetical protein
MSDIKSRLEQAERENSELRKALQEVRALIPQRMGAETIREHLQRIVRNTEAGRSAT